MMSWLKDPLLVFLIAGAAIFTFAGFGADDPISWEVNVTEADLQRLNDQWQMQMRRPPTEREMEGLVEQFLREEIYYREARRLGLDLNDTIVRRRMVQKLTFLTEDIASAAPADEAALRAHYEANRDDYRVPERYTFRHRYFSSDRRENAEQDARDALDDPASEGDPFMLQRSYAQRSTREIGDLFGRDFADAIAGLQPAETWQGPVQSAYGWHAVLLTSTAPSHVQPFDAVAERVRVDVQQARRKAANEAYYADLKARYDITFPPTPAS